MCHVGQTPEILQKKNLDSEQLEELNLSRESHGSARESQRVTWATQLEAVGRLEGWVQRQTDAPARFEGAAFIVERAAWEIGPWRKEAT